MLTFKKVGFPGSAEPGSTTRFDLFKDLVAAWKQPIRPDAKQSRYRVTALSFHSFSKL